MHYSLCDYLLDLVQNSIEADAKRIDLTIREREDLMMEVIIKDDGYGMTETEMAKAIDPFFTDGVKHKARRVGLGLPFLVQTVSMTGGKYTLSSQKGEGTLLEILFNTGHIDTPPLGNLPALLQQCFCFDGDYEMEIVRIYREKDRYTVSRKEIQEIMGDLNQASNMILLKDFLLSQEEGINKE